MGPENSGLSYLFDQSTISRLQELSPVLICGERGLGRTDLAITLALRWSRLLDLKPMCFATGHDFFREYASAIEIGDLASFRNRYRSCKMLVIDHLDPLAEKPPAQEELAATIDALMALSRPVIVTASGLPTSLTGLSSRLASRLAAGFSVTLAYPGRQARACLLDSLIQLDRCDLPVSELVAIADDFSSDQPLSPATLVTLVKLANQNRLANGHLDNSVLRSLLRQHLLDDAPSVSAIAKLVSRKMRVKVADVRGNRRLARIVRARGLAILLSRKWTTHSLQQLGHYFGGRDHSTILHACRKTARLLTEDPELANLCRDIEVELLG